MVLVDQVVRVFRYDLVHLSTNFALTKKVISRLDKLITKFTFLRKKTRGDSAKLFLQIAGLVYI